MEKGRAFVFGGNVTFHTDNLSWTTLIVEYFKESPLSGQEAKYFWLPVGDNPVEPRKTPILPDPRTLKTRTPSRTSATPNNRRSSARLLGYSNFYRRTRANPVRPASQTDQKGNVASRTQETAKDAASETQPSPTLQGKDKGVDGEQNEEDPSHHPAWPALQERLKTLGNSTTSSTLDKRPEPSPEDYPNFSRPRSPKSRNASRNRHDGADPVMDRDRSVSQASIPITISPGCFASAMAGNRQQVNETILVSRPTSQLPHRTATNSSISRKAFANSNKYHRSSSISHDIRSRTPRFASHPDLVGGAMIKRPETTQGIRPSSATGARADTWLETTHHRPRQSSRSRSRNRSREKRILVDARSRRAKPIDLSVPRAMFTKPQEDGQGAVGSQDPAINGLLFRPCSAVDPVEALGAETWPPRRRAMSRAWYLYGASWGREGGTGACDVAWLRVCVSNGAFPFFWRKLVYNSLQLNSDGMCYCTLPRLLIQRYEPMQVPAVQPPLISLMHMSGPGFVYVDSPDVVLSRKLIVTLRTNCHDDGMGA